MRRFLSALVLLSLCSAAPAAIAAGTGTALPPGGAKAVTSAALETSIVALEKKYFEHAYPADLTEARLERLEKLVFGEIRTGTDNDRVIRLQGIADESANEAPYSPSAATRSASAATSGGGGNSKAPNTQADTAPSYDEAADADASKYPRVTALETSILGQTFTTEPVHRRLDQLEIKAFGKPTGVEDMSTRCDKLEQYAISYLHKRPFGVNPAMNDDPYNQVLTSHSAPTSFSQLSNRTSSDSLSQLANRGFGFPTEEPSAAEFPTVRPPSSAPMLTKVSWMEGTVFGHTFSDEHLMDRLQRLEVSVFPHHPAEDKYKLMDQTDDLMNAVALLHGHKPGSSPAVPQIASADTGTAGSPPATAHDHSTTADSVQKNPLFRSISKALSAAGKLAEESGGSSPMSPGYMAGTAGPSGYMGMGPGPGISF